MLQLKLGAAKLKKKKKLHPLIPIKKKNPGGSCWHNTPAKSWQGNTKIWYHLRMEKTEEIHIEFQYIILLQVYKC